MSNWNLRIALVALVIGYTVRAGAVPTVVNPGFEADTYLNGPGGLASQNGGTITNWTIAGGAANVGLNPFWTDGTRTTIAGTPHADNGVVPEGDQVALLRVTGSLSQVVSGFEVGKSYRVRYRENNRSGTHSPGGLEVALGGQVVVADHATTNVEGGGLFTVPYRSIASDVFVATATSHALTFASTTGTDDSVLIDDVRIMARTDAIAHWKLDEASGQIAFDSAGSNDGQLGTSPVVDAADPTINQPGQFGTAFSFDSTENDRVDVSAHIANFSSLTSGTITGWFNTDNNTGRGALLNFGEASTTDRMLVEMLDDGSIRFLVREADSNVTDLTTSASFEDGTWHHFAVTNDGSTTSLLIDGAAVPLSSTTNSASWFDDLTGASSFTLGYEVRTNGQFPFDGLLDDFAIFDHVLTREQLSNVINFGAENFLGLSIVPEPSAFALTAAGLLSLGCVGWRRRRRA